MKKKPTKAKVEPKRTDSEIYTLSVMRRLREIKEEADLTYEKMAPLLGVSVFTLSRWFSGGIKQPNQLAMQQILRFISGYASAKAHNTPMSQFLQGGQL